jgi:hypothetical protein
MEFYHIKREAILESTGLLIRDATHDGMARQARLNFDTRLGWVPAQHKENPYLEIDLGIERVFVTAVATQGDARHDRGVYKYALSFSTDRLDWFDYREEWETKVTTLNSFSV